MGQLDIADLLGAEIRLPDGREILVEREIGDGLLDIRLLPTGELFRVEDPLTGELHLTDASFIEGLSASGDLDIVRRRDGHRPVSPPPTRTYEQEEIRRLDPYAEARLHLVRALRDRGVDPTAPDLGKQVRAIWAEKGWEGPFGPPPENRRVRAWFGRADVQQVCLEDMMSRSGRVRRRSPIDPALNAIYEKHAHDHWYKKKRGWTVADATGDAALDRRKENARRTLTGEAPLPEVNRETMRRRINALLCRDAYAAKMGEPAARRKFDGGGEGLRATRILEYGIMDDTVFDCLTVVQGGVAGRPYFSALLDVHSRGVPGLAVSFTPPSHHTAALVLRRANRSKTIRPDRLARHPALAKISGKFARLIVDNGKNYVSPSFIETCASLGTTVQVAPVAMPRAKAMIERFFHTLKQYLLSKLPGHTLDPSQLRKLGINPSTEAVLTLETLEMLVEEFLFYYHTRVHSGISTSPVEKWKASMALGHRHVLDSERKLDALFGVVVHGRRITANGGVRIFSNLTYKSADMRRLIIDRLAGSEPHRTRLDGTTACTVKVRYDPADLGHIWVEVGHEWVRLRCTDQDYASGLSLWQHRQIRAYARRERLRVETEEDRLVARAELNHSIQEHLPDLKMQERRVAARFVQGEAPSAVSAVEHAVAEPRHDGLGPIVAHEPAHIHRDDLHRPHGRPSQRSGDPEDDDASPENSGHQAGDAPPQRFGGASDGSAEHRPGERQPDPEGDDREGDVGDEDDDLGGFEPPLWEPPVDEDERFKDFD